MAINDNKKKSIVICGKSGGSAEGAVRYDESQVLTNEQQAQARENIGAISQADVLNYKQIPSDWDTSHTMADLIADIAADDTAVEGKSYMGTVTITDLPASMVQAEMIIDVMSVDEGLGKNILFTVTSSNTAPYHWEYTSAYGATGTWRGFQPQEWYGTQQEYDAIQVKDPNVTYNIEGIDVDWSDIDNKPTFATVATSGDYTDLSNTPTIPAAQVQSDWNANSGMGEILNKPSTETLTFTLSNNTTVTLDVYVATVLP